MAFVQYPQNTGFRLSSWQLVKFVLLKIVLVLSLLTQIFWFCYNIWAHSADSETITNFLSHSGNILITIMNFVSLFAGYIIFLILTSYARNLVIRILLLANLVITVALELVRLFGGIQIPGIYILDLVDGLIYLPALFLFIFGIRMSVVSAYSIIKIMMVSLYLIIAVLNLCEVYNATFWIVILSQLLNFVALITLLCLSKQRVTRHIATNPKLII